MVGVFSPETGNLAPVTAVRVGPCVVTQIKTAPSDGYHALQLGFDQKKKKRLNRPQLGHLKKSGNRPIAVLREFSVDNPDDFTVGQILTLRMFEVGEHVDITGTTKGRGFAGVIKRHGFHGGKKSHGSHSHRIPGSIGSSAWPSRVAKGKKLPGHYGNERKTVKNLEIVDIRPEENIVLFKGAIPGPRSGLILIRKRQVGVVE